MAIDPNIALGVRPIEVPNQLAQYGQLAAIQNAQNQNALAQYQLSSAQRADLAQTDLAEAYKKSINPETGAIDKTALFSNVAQSRAAHLLPDIQAKMLETESKQANIKKTGIETQEKEFKLKKDQLDFAWNAVGSALTPQDAIQKINDGVKNGHFDMKTASADIQQLQNMTPEQYQQYRVQKVMGILDAKDKLGFMLPKTRDRDTGGVIQVIQDNPALPGYGLPIAGMNIGKTATIADKLAREKFDFEKANPGYELKEAEDGSIVGVNKRTLQAFPVSIGGAAPAAQPMPMPSAGMPGARMPAATTVPAIPGMTSVLDQQAPAAAPVSGTPLMGKGTAMTEGQSNAAMFGGAMAQAQNTIKQLEKSGTVKNAVVPGLLTGLTQMVPFGVGEGIGNVIQSTFNADPTGLIGPNSEQQKLAQAQLAFATAYLRKTSGASFGASEVSNTIKEFFPLIGEGEKVIAQKAAARERAIEGMKMSTSKEGKKYIETYGGGGAPVAAGNGGISGASANNPLGLPGL